MEWRIFVPVLVNIRNEELQQLFSDLNKEICIFSEGFVAEDEKRSDQYLITHPNFGIKFRSEKKLEMKVRIERNKHGIEQWRKYKFGKSSILEQLNPVCKVLKDSGYEDLLEVFQNRIVQGRAMVVEKSRKNFPLSNVCVEICTLQVLSNHWLSVAVESISPEFISTFLFSRMVPFFSKLSEIVTFCKRHEISFQPLICGYPQWIQHVDGHFPFASEEWDEAIAPLTIMFSHCKI